MGRPRLFDRLKERYEAVLNGEGHEFTVTMPDPVKKYTALEVAAIRTRLKMTQTEFAMLLNVSVKTIESWEQDVNPPSKAAARLLQVVENPDSFSRVIHARESAAAVAG